MPLFKPLPAVYIADVWRHTCWHRYLIKNGDGSLAWNPEDDPERLAAVHNGDCSWVIPATLVLLAFVSQLARVPVPIIGHGWVRFDKDFVPIDMHDAVKSVPASRIFNDLDPGGYMIFFAPHLKSDDMLKE